MDKIGVRYIVNDVDAAVIFYRDRLGFAVDMHPGPGFAMLSRGALQLFLNRPGVGGAGQATTDGMPQPGGWNRFQLRVEDLAETFDGLSRAGCHFRSDIITGQGGRQVVIDDPSGNPIELFEPRESR